MNQDVWQYLVCLAPKGLNLLVEHHLLKLCHKYETQKHLEKNCLSFSFLLILSGSSKQKTPRSREGHQHTWFGFHHPKVRLTNNFLVLHCL
jgi:hypothetical protein